MPTKWERMVEKERLAYTLGVDNIKIIRCDVVAKLLARQHARMVRMVKLEATESVLRIRDAEQRRDDRNALIAEGHRQMCAGILATLAKEKGGK